MTDHEHTPEAGIGSLTGSELWEILFSVFEGDVPKALTDAKLDEVASAIRSAFGSAPALAAGVEAPGLRVVEDMHERAWARESEAGNLDKAEWHRECAEQIRALATVAPVTEEPSEAEVEELAERLTSRLESEAWCTFADNQRPYVRAIAASMFRRYAAAHARASQQGGK